MLSNGEWKYLNFHKFYSWLVFPTAPCAKRNGLVYRVSAQIYSGRSIVDACGSIWTGLKLQNLFFLKVAGDLAVIVEKPNSELLLNLFVIRTIWTTVKRKTGLMIVVVRGQWYDKNIVEEKRYIRYSTDTVPVQFLTNYENEQSYTCSRENKGWIDRKYLKPQPLWNCTYPETALWTSICVVYKVRLIKYTCRSSSQKQICRISVCIVYSRSPKYGSAVTIWQQHSSSWWSAETLPVWYSKTLLFCGKPESKRIRYEYFICLIWEMQAGDPGESA